MGEWAKIMSDKKSRTIVISMLKEAKKVGGIFRNRNVVLREVGIKC